MWLESLSRISGGVRVEMSPVGVGRPGILGAAWSRRLFVMSQADRLKALGHPDRLRIVEALSRTSMNVGGIAAAVRMPNAAVSRHLRVLADAEIVRCSRRGNYVLYVLADRDVIRLALVAYRGAGQQARRRLMIGRPM